MEKLLRMKDLTEMTGFGPDHIYKMIRKGTFPKQIKLSERSSRWIKSEVNTWIEETIKLSRKAV
jgi:prophage regulatory protein